MKREINNYLEDILKYSTHILSQSKALSKEEFCKDFGKQCELIRCLEVIGEATKKLVKADASYASSYPEVPWSTMARMRDILIHHYEEANLDIIWDTIKKDIPSLELQISKILSQIKKCT